MANRECEWVRARLPLWVGDGVDDQIDGARESGDLAAKDCREIDRHMSGCTSCRRYRSALEEAMAALYAAAAHMPREAAPTSLWPELERRIASGDTYVVSHWRRGLSCVADRWARARTLLDREQPLRLGWIHDTVREALTGTKGRARQFNREFGMVLRFGMMSLICVTLVGGLVLHREWTDAQSMIVANSASLTNEDLLATIPENPIDLADAAEMGDEDSPGQLAEVDLGRSAELASSGTDGASTAKLPAQTRLGNDLDHGTPVTPDARDTKPVY